MESDCWGDAVLALQKLQISPEFLSLRFFLCKRGQGNNGTLLLLLPVKHQAHVGH